MNVSELFNLTLWISNEISEKKLVPRYQTLQKILFQHAQPNGQRQPLEEPKNELINTLKSISTLNLTRDQVIFLNQLKILENIGESGVKKVEEVLFKNVIDVATSASKIEGMITELNYGVQKSNQIQKGLNEIQTEEEYEADDEILMRVSFTGDASLNNIIEFKYWANIWFEIGRGISLIHGNTPEDVKIVGATKGSIVLELAVVAAIATTTSGIILAALKVVDRVLEIRKKVEEIKNLKLKNTKLTSDLEKEAESEKESGIAVILEEIKKRQEISSSSEGDKITALEKSIKNLVNFIDKGGIIDFVIPEDVDEESEKRHLELRNAFEEIKKLESKISLLEENL